MCTGAFFSPIMVSSLWCSGKREEKATPGAGASDPDTSRLGKKEEERKTDSELSSISYPEGSGRARNILTVAIGRDATELKDFRETWLHVPQLKTSSTGTWWHLQRH